MIRVEPSLNRKVIRRLIWLVLTIFALLSCSLQNAVGSAYYVLSMQPSAVIGSPPVMFEEGVVGSSTIYTNKTSAKVGVTAPLFDYIGNNDCDVDSSADRGSHSNFTAQQTDPGAMYDTLSEENIEAIEDYVDNNTSDEDSLSDVGTHSNFENQKDSDSIYDTLTEQNTVGEIAKVGIDTSGTGINLTTLSFSHTLVSGTARIVIVSIGVENGDTIDVSTVTYGGVQMTRAVEGITGTSGFRYLCEIWYILEANLPSDGSKTVEITCTAIVYELEINAFCSEYTGVDQGIPEATAEYHQTTGSTITNSINPSNKAWVISAVGAGNAGSWTHGEGQAEVLDFADSSSAFAVAELRGASIETSLSSAFSGTVNRLERVAASWAEAIEDDNYELNIEIQFTAVIDFLLTEALCINTGMFSGTEDIAVDFWNGTGWENLAADLTAYSSNEYFVSLTSSTFTIRFRDGTTGGDTIQDQWQIDASLLRVEGAGGDEDTVDQQSNVNGSADVGTHSNFSALQAGPDSTNDTLTEWNAGGAINTTLINAESFEGSWLPTGWTETVGSNWNRENNYAYSGVYSADFDGALGDPSGYLTTPSMNCSGVSAIYVDFWWYDYFLGADDFELEYYNGSAWVNYQDLDALASANGWHYYTENLTDSQYFVSNFQIRWWAKTVSNGETGCVDLVMVKKTIQYPDDYELDLEVQWTDLLYSLPNEELCIYSGTTGTEDINVDVWNGTDWETIFADLSFGWNNQSITSWLTSSNFTMRFKGGNETGDTSQDAWQIDVALIHLWHNGEESYELDLEVQWMNTDYTRTNEELCIKTGPFSGSENIQVRVWNSTGSSWHWVMNLTANQWNNVSIASYLTSNVFTMQFLGGTETGDTSKDSWNIDATLLHIWTNESAYDYVLRVNNTVTDSWQIRLKQYTDTNISRIQNCTIYFHNSTDGTLGQIRIQNGLYINQTGPWYDLGSLETIYIAMTVETNSVGTSYVYAYLEVNTPNTTTYTQYIVTFTIT